jgi:hypothetical protein
MKLPSLLFCLLFVSACTEPGPVGKNGSDEPEFFRADRNGTGPLTLDELQINIPGEIDRTLTASRRSCFLEAVTRRANEAGDPADLDPDAFPYWGGEVDQSEWRQHSTYMQRILLAQAIISWAMSDC